METIFDTRDFAPELRFRAWQEMICDVYVHLDVTADDTSACEGRVRVAGFGAVKLTETTGFPQRFMRRKSHLAALDKDCLYMQFVKRGAMHVVQRNSTVVSHPGAGCLISASDPYDAIYRTTAQAFYLELPREPFLARFPAGALPPPNTILRTGSGLGRVAQSSATYWSRKAPPFHTVPETIWVSRSWISSRLRWTDVRPMARKLQSRARAYDRSKPSSTKTLPIQAYRWR